MSKFRTATSTTTLASLTPAAMPVTERNAASVGWFGNVPEPARLAKAAKQAVATAVIEAESRIGLKHIAIVEAEVTSALVIAGTQRIGILSVLLNDHTNEVVSDLREAGQDHMLRLITQRAAAMASIEARVAAGQLSQEDGNSLKQLMEADFVADVEGARARTAASVTVVDQLNRCSLEGMEHIQHKLS